MSEQLGKRIKTLESTYRIVRITELAPLAKLGVLRKQAERAVSYYENILESLQNVRGTLYLADREREEKKVSVLVITSDRGLCGSYNSNVFKKIDEFLETVKPDQEVDFFVIGEQGYEYLKRKEQNIHEFMKISLADITIEQADAITSSFLKRIFKKELDSLHIIFTKYISPVESVAMIQKVYPDPQPYQSKVLPDYILDYDETDEEVEELLLTNYMSGLLYSMFLYSVASEYCTRRMAMKEARENIEKNLAELKQKKKKDDLQKKTNELLDIISGSRVIREEE